MLLYCSFPHETTFQGEELTNNGEKYEMVPSELPPRVQSKLIIKKTEEDNFGTYQVGHKQLFSFRQLYKMPIIWETLSWRLTRMKFFFGFSEQNFPPCKVTYVLYWLI